MKLSIEQKAKAYDEALKVLHKYDGANIMFSQSLKEEMFPELVDSEEERIREWLIGYFKRNEVAKIIKTDDILAWLEKQGEQKSAWSEEDEACKNTILCAAQGNFVTEAAFKQAIDWLKSLRLQNHWKPSELQLWCLSDAIEHNNSLGYSVTKLKELYEQLKKLL